MVDDIVSPFHDVDIVRPFEDIRCRSAHGMPYWMMGDDTFESGDMKARRGKLRSDERVCATLDVWWATAQRSKGSAEGALTFKEYARISRKIYKAMIELYDHDEAMQVAAEEWETDRKGADVMCRTRFADSIFQLADLWTLGVEADEYVEFLWGLFRCIAKGSPPDAYFWKADPEITWGGYVRPPSAASSASDADAAGAGHGAAELVVADMVDESCDDHDPTASAADATISAAYGRRRADASAAQGCPPLPAGADVAPSTSEQLAAAVELATSTSTHGAHGRTEPASVGPSEGGRARPRSKPSLRSSGSQRVLEQSAPADALAARSAAHTPVSERSASSGGLGFARGGSVALVGAGGGAAADCGADAWERPTERDPWKHAGAAGLPFGAEGALGAGNVEGHLGGAAGGAHAAWRVGTAGSALDGRYEAMQWGEYDDSRLSSSSAGHVPVSRHSPPPQLMWTEAAGGCGGTSAHSLPPSKLGRVAPLPAAPPLPPPYQRPAPKGSSTWAAGSKLLTSMRAVAGKDGQPPPVDIPPGSPDSPSTRHGAGSSLVRSASGALAAVMRGGRSALGAVSPGRLSPARVSRCLSRDQRARRWQEAAEAARAEEAAKAAGAAAEVAAAAAAAAAETRWALSDEEGEQHPHQHASTSCAPKTSRSPPSPKKLTRSRADLGLVLAAREQAARAKRALSRKRVWPGLLDI